MIPWVVAVGIGLSLNNSLAVFDGLFSHDATFIRTAKFGAQGRADRRPATGYQTPSTKMAWGELLLAAYFGFGCVTALTHQLFLSLPSVALFAVGFGYVGGLSLWQGSRAQGWWLAQALSPEAVLAQRPQLQAELQGQPSAGG